MKRYLTVIAVVALGSAALFATIASAKSPIAHQVSAGGPDACVDLGFTHPGCDGDLALNAIEYADGSVSGQLSDRFAQGDGFHAVIDCLFVEDNMAWVSGVVTSGRVTDPDTGERFDLAGLYVRQRVVDNGTSANDPPDQVGFSVFSDEPFDCTLKLGLALLDAPWGQVTVR